MIAIGLASVFAAFGLWQQATKELLYEPELEVANAYSPFFRVTSLFTDPSLYGRHVVLGFAVLLVLLWAGKIGVALAAPLMVLLAGLYFSYSQSSMAALFVVAAAVTLVAGDRTARRAVLVATAVALIVAAGFVSVQARDESIQLTSGRWQRAELTIDVVREQPLLGVGLGAQPKVSRELAPGGAPARRGSCHTRRRSPSPPSSASSASRSTCAAAGGDRDALLRETLPTPALALGAVLLALFTTRWPTAVSSRIRSPGSPSAWAPHISRSRRPPGNGAGARRQPERLRAHNLCRASDAARGRRRPRRAGHPRRDHGAGAGASGVAVQVPPGGTDPQGPFGWLVRAADREFDIALLRACFCPRGSWSHSAPL